MRKWALGVMAAQRPDDRALTKTVDALQAAGWEPDVFAEPGTGGLDKLQCEVHRRPGKRASLSWIQPGAYGIYGNFQHWFQTAADLLQMYPYADFYSTVEDDAVVCKPAKAFVEQFLWPSEKCGAVSLYCANITEQRSVVPKFFRIQRNGIMGTLFMIWRKECLMDLVYNTDPLQWKGGQPGRKTIPEVHKWNGIDTYLGQQMNRMSWENWLFSPSLVHHYQPSGTRSYSAVGNSAAVGKRQAYRFVGMEPDLGKVFFASIKNNAHRLEVLSSEVK